MTQKEWRVYRAAIDIARRSTTKRGKHVTHCLVYWPLLDELRAALENDGTQW